MLNFFKCKFKQEGFAAEKFHSKSARQIHTKSCGFWCIFAAAYFPGNYEKKEKSLVLKSGCCCKSAVNLQQKQRLYITCRFYWNYWLPLWRPCGKSTANPTICIRNWLKNVLKLMPRVNFLKRKKCRPHTEFCNLMWILPVHIHR